MAQELALAPLPDDVDVCLAEAEELLFARDRITCALADRVGRVHRAGQAKQHGHASTRCWLRTAAGMTVGGAGRLLMLGAELPRLPQVREKFAAGELAAGVVEAICAAIAGLTDENAALAEPILVELAGKAGAAEVAKAGRHLRAVLDPDGEERDEQADYGRRFLRVRPGKGGGVEGEFYIPREPGARLMTLLQEYAKKKADGDDRTLTERQADALIAALEQQIVTELLVVVSAESLPTDPENTDPENTDPENTDPATDDPADPATDDPADPAADDTGAPAPYEAETDDGPESADDTRATAATGLGDVREAKAAAAAAATAPATDSAYAPGPGDTAAGLPDEDIRGCGVGERGAGERRPGEYEPRDTANAASTEGDHAANTIPAEGDDTASTSSANCDENAAFKDGDGDSAAAQTGAPHATRGAPAWPADGVGHSHTAPSDATASGATASGAPPSHTEPPHAAHLEAAQPDPPPEDASTRHTHAGPQPAGDCRHGQGIPGALGTALGGSLGASLGMVPGLLLATGQVLPLSSVHRLARTSTLVRIVMNAEGQVLDMGRKVRLATPAQRRAIYARYATCWIDGCPLPATMCQIDHADNWSTGGLTDLKLLGPACQFHNRDRYQHPERYTRHKAGTDRWAFTYHRLGRARRLHE
ncbi:HNH endonuclease signature motif containing protein [Microbispora hainanensis]